MQAAKIRGLGRLLAVIVFLGMSQSLSASLITYYTLHSYPAKGRFASAALACASIKPSGGQTTVLSGGTNCSVRSHSLDSWTFASFINEYTNLNCPYGDDGNFFCNTSCSAPKQLVNGQCILPPEPETSCESRQNIYSAQECSYVEALKIYNCPTSLSLNGCEYVSAGRSNCNKATNICTGQWAPSGNGAAPDGEECTEDTCVNVPDSSSNPDPSEGSGNEGGSSSPDDQCVQGTDGIRYCLDDPETGCGTFNGSKACPQPDKDCRSHNGEWICTDPQKDNRNCNYVKGEQVCVNPKNPTQLISADSPDHPKNGGNADGNPNNDPMEPNSSTGTPSASNPQGSNEAATNETVKGVGESLGGKLDKGNGLLGDILGTLKDIRGAMSGGGGGGGGGGGNGDGDGGEGEGECEDESAGCESGEDGSGVGDGTDLAALIGEKGAELLEERETDSQSFLDALPDSIADLFGEDGSEVGLGSSALKELFPAHSSCNDLTIPLNFMGKSFSLVIPVCELTRVKPLLEWLIWCITLIGLWNILYTGLRQQDAKAVKGGF